MGNCISSNDDAQDKNISDMGKFAVKPNMNTIDSEVLDMALASINPMNELRSKMTLNFAANGLPNLDTVSKTDPMLVIW